MTPGGARLALEAWVAYDAALTVLVHVHGREVGWTGKAEPKLDRLYERALVITRVVMDLPMGALGEGELSRAEVAQLAAEARGA